MGCSVRLLHPTYYRRGTAMMVNIVEEAPGVVQYVEEGFCLASRGRKLFVRCGVSSPWRTFTSLPVKEARDLLAFNRLGCRLARVGIHHIEKTACGDFVVASGRHLFFLSSDGELIDRGVRVFGSRPLNLCPTPDGGVYYGEYRSNPERGPVHVHGWNPKDGTWKPRYTFTGVRHVHGVWFDPFENAIWVTTGDRDHESAIWRSRDQFTSLERVAGGNQQLRAVQLVFTQDYVYFGTDSPLEENYIHRMHRSNGYVEAMQKIPGPVFFGGNVGRDLVFTTICEPNKLGQPRQATLWYGDQDGESWKCVLSREKDRLHMKLFQYGQLKLSSGDLSSDRFWVTPYATSGDQRSIRLEIVPSGDFR